MSFRWKLNYTNKHKLYKYQDNFYKDHNKRHSLNKLECEQNLFVAPVLN